MMRRLVFGHTHLVSPVWKICMSINISCSVSLYFFAGVERVGPSPPAALKKPQPSILENMNKRVSLLYYNMF